MTNSESFQFQGSSLTTGHGQGSFLDDIFAAHFNKSFAVDCFPPEVLSTRRTSQVFFEWRQFLSPLSGDNQNHGRTLEHERYLNFEQNPDADYESGRQFHLSSFRVFDGNGGPVHVSSSLCAQLFDDGEELVNEDENLLIEWCVDFEQLSSDRRHVLLLNVAETLSWASRFVARFLIKSNGQFFDGPNFYFQTHCSRSIEETPTAALNRPLATLHSLPLVSVLVPTYNRPRLLAHSIERICQQSYERLEIIILDDSPHCSASEMRSACSGAGDNRQRLIRPLCFPERMSVGAKRSAGALAAFGEIIIHWDDDDWYHWTRIAYQVAPIIRGVSDVTVLRWTHSLLIPKLVGDARSVRHDHLPDEQQQQTEQGERLIVPKIFRRELNEPPHQRTRHYSFATLCYRADMFAPGAGAFFSDTSLAEDVFFFNRLMVQRQKRVVILPSTSLFAYVRHVATTFSMDVFRFPFRWTELNFDSFFADSSDRDWYANLAQIIFEDRPDEPMAPVNFVCPEGESIGKEPEGGFC